MVLHRNCELQQSCQAVSRSFDGNAPDVLWVINVAEFAQSGILLGVILLGSVIWLPYQLHNLPVIVANYKTRVPGKQWIYELASQLARATAFIFFAFAYVDGKSHFLHVAVLGYVQILGLFRLADDIHLRHRVLHHVNFVMTAILLVVTAAYLLPCVQVSKSQCTADVRILGGVISLAVAAFVSSITPRTWSSSNIDPENGAYINPRTSTPEENCSWFSYYCSYGWLTPLIWKGLKNKLDMASLPPLAWYDEPKYLLHKIRAARSIAKTTFWTVFRFLRKELILMALWIGLSSCLDNVAPFAMFKLIAHTSNPGAATYHPWVWPILMFIGPIARAVSYQQYMFISTRLSVRLKSGMTQELYHKVLGSMELDESSFSTVGTPNNAKTSRFREARKISPTGRLTNLMAADIDAIHAARDIVTAVVGVPIGITISFIGLYHMMGWASIVGILIIVLAIPLSIILGKIMYSFQNRVRKAQDGRISLITECISSIQAIKILAWEDAMTGKIDNARAAEQKGLWKVAVLQSVINGTAQAVPYIGLVVMFGLYVGIEKRRLDASTAFTSIILLTNIRRYARAASTNSRKFTGAIVAFKRLDKYFESAVSLVQHPRGPLNIQNASFRRNKLAVFSLHNISIDFIQGGLNVVTGQSGSGKTTLLLSILGETHIESGTLTGPRDIAFASQSPWLQSGTIRDNILFHTPEHRIRYENVIRACCLDSDLENMQRGDMTIIGENGTSLSGGQMARVALARVLYSQSRLLLLDDIFSALDSKTLMEVWRRCFCSPLLAKRTIVLVTQVPWITSQASLGIVLEKGRVKSIQTNLEAVRQVPTIYASPTSLCCIPDTLDGTKVASEPKGDFKSRSSAVINDETVKEVVNEEMKASGTAGRLKFFQYMKYFGNPTLIAVCAFCTLFSNGIFFFSGYWMSIWVRAYDHKVHVDTAYYMGLYAVFTILGTLVVGANIVTFEWGGWCAARTIHSDFIRAVMSAPLFWFKSVSLGQITNRFSRDMSSIDKSLISALRTAIFTSVTLLFRIIGVSALLPVFIVPVLFASALSAAIGEMYVRTAIILKRLASSAHSPIFSHFASTLAGLQVLRATSGTHEAFVQELEIKLRVWSAAAEANYNSNRWLALRVGLVTAIISMMTGIIALSKIGTVSAGLVGFSLRNAIGLTNVAMTLVKAMNDLEIEMQSFHRVEEYVKIESEDKNDVPYLDERDMGEDDCLINGDDLLPTAWPRCGEIEFRNVTVRYDKDGPDILTDLSLTVKAGERVAIVGRTGSGKTTLIMTLLRFTHIVAGQILYDGIDITKISRLRLRQSVTVVPQETTMFSGSIQSNIEPTGCVSADDISQILKRCSDIASLSDNTTAQTNGYPSGISLSADVDARGGNFSHGQRQVIALCRALIRKSKLMLLDEATASMDYEADQGVQRVLREELEKVEDSTLVTVAHRLRTVVDYDTIVVMDSGRVIEHGSPRELYNARGHFYDMMCQSGEAEELQGML